MGIHIEYPPWFSTIPLSISTYFVQSGRSAILDFLSWGPNSVPSFVAALTWYHITEYKNICVWGWQNIPYVRCYMCLISTNTSYCPKVNEVWTTWYHLVPHYGVLTHMYCTLETSAILDCHLWKPKEHTTLVCCCLDLVLHCGVLAHTYRIMENLPSWISNHVRPNSIPSFIATLTWYHITLTFLFTAIIVRHTFHWPLKLPTSCPSNPFPKCWHVLKCTCIPFFKIA